MKEGWDELKLGEVYSFKNGVNFNKHDKTGKGILTLDVLNMYKGCLMPELKKLYRVDKAFGKDYHLQTNDILIVRSSVKEEGVAWATYFDTYDEPMTYCGFIIRGRPLQEINARFSVYFLRSPLVRRELISKSVKSTITNINQQILSGISIPLPPLPEQEAIVAILDKAFTAIDQAKANIEQNIANAKELFQSKLNQIFSQKGEGWEETTLGDESILIIVDGDRGKNYPKKSDFLEKGHCAFLNTSNVRPDGFKFDKVMFISKERDELLRKGKLERQDIVMTTRGTIGNLGWYNSNVPYQHIRINSGMLIFRVNQRKLLPEYLFTLFRSSVITSQIREQTSGAAQPQLPIKTLVKFVIPFCSNLRKQKEMVGKIEEMEAFQVALLHSYKAKLTSLDELKKSILQKAFAGELT